MTYKSRITIQHSKPLTEEEARQPGARPNEAQTINPGDDVDPKALGWTDEQTAAALAEGRIVQVDDRGRAQEPGEEVRRTRRAGGARAVPPREVDEGYQKVTGRRDIPVPPSTGTTTLSGEAVGARTHVPEGFNPDAPSRVPAGAPVTGTAAGGTATPTPAVTAKEAAATKETAPAPQPAAAPKQ